MSCVNGGPHSSFAPQPLPHNRRGNDSLQRTVKAEMRTVKVETRGRAMGGVLRGVVCTRELLTNFSNRPQPRVQSRPPTEVKPIVIEVARCHEARERAANTFGTRPPNDTRCGADHGGELPETRAKFASRPEQ